MYFDDNNDTSINKFIILGKESGTVLWLLLVLLYHWSP